MSEIRNKLAEKGLKVTPQRVAIFEAINKLNKHPTADNIADYLKSSQPSIVIGTIYKF